MSSGELTDAPPSSRSNSVSDQVNVTRAADGAVVDASPEHVVREDGVLAVRSQHPSRKYRTGCWSDIRSV